MTKKVNIGILDYGFVQSTFHLPCYKEISTANVVAVGGRRKEVAEEFANKWGIKKKSILEKILSKSYVQILKLKWRT